MMAEEVSAQEGSCLVCRSRKVKCDGASPTCRNCEALGIDCSGYGAAGRLGADTLETIYRASGVEKRRVGSCEACRKAKGRCDKGRPSCSRCLQRSLACHYSQRQRHRRSIRSNASPPSPRISESHETSPIVSLDIASGPSMSLIERIDVKALPHDIKSITTAYFDRIATLRCLGFLHKPSFNHSLDKGSLIQDYNEAVIYAICAHGSRIKALESGSPTDATGQTWAEEAQNLVMKEIGKPTLMTAMALVLLGEFALQTGQDALAFMLSGCCHSVARLLALDRNSETTQDTIMTESRRRVLWSCFILDSIVGGGVNENLRWRDKPPQIPLPSSDQSFLSQSTTQETPLLLPINFNDNASVEDFNKYNLRSNLVYLMTIRNRVLQLIRLSPEGIEISHPQSLFMQTVHALETWPNSVSAQLQLTELSLYVHKELHTLEPLFYLHLAYHTLICDLTRISIPGFDFPLAAAFRVAPQAFISQCQNLCQYHAAQVTQVLRMMNEHIRPLFTDCTTRMAVYETTKIMIVYVASMGEGSHSSDLRRQLLENITFNMKVLNGNFANSVPNRAAQALTRLLSRSGFHDIVNNVCTVPSSRPDDDPVEVSGPSEAFYLSEVAPFRRAYNDANRSDRRESMTGSSLGTSTQSAPSVGQWNPQVPLPLDMAQILPLGDYTQVVANMSEEITWDFFSLPAWEFQQKDMDFGV